MNSMALEAFWGKQPYGLRYKGGNGRDSWNTGSLKKMNEGEKYAVLFVFWKLLGRLNVDVSTWGFIHAGRLVLSWLYTFAIWTRFSK
jgi:hypothetical protein